MTSLIALHTLIYERRGQDGDPEITPLDLYFISNLGERKFPPPRMLSIFSLSLSLWQGSWLVGVIHCINKYKPHTNQLAADKN